MLLSIRTLWFQSKDIKLFLFHFLRLSSTNQLIACNRSNVPVNRIAELYGPLLNHLSNPSFISKLVENILNLISITENDNSLDLLRSNPAISTDKKEENDYMCNSLKYWIQYFFKERSTPSLENPWFEDISQEIVYLIQYPQPW